MQCKVMQVILAQYEEIYKINSSNKKNSVIESSLRIKLPLGEKRVPQFLFQLG